MVIKNTYERAFIVIISTPIETSTRTLTQFFQHQQFDQSKISVLFSCAKKSMTIYRQSIFNFLIRLFLPPALIFTKADVKIFSLLLKVKNTQISFCLKYFPTRRLSGFEILNNATLIFQEWLVTRHFANIFHYLNFSEEYL